MKDKGIIVASHHQNQENETKETEDDSIVVSEILVGISKSTLIPLMLILKIEPMKFTAVIHMEGRFKVRWVFKGACV